MSARSAISVLSFVVMTAAIALGAGATPALAQGCGCNHYPDMTAFGFVTNPKPDCDRDFVRMAQNGQAFEAALGREAADRGASDSVKQFGQDMARENTLARERLLAIAGEHGLGGARDMDTTDRDELDSLSILQDRDFDRAYIDRVISDQSNNLRLFQRIADEAERADLRNYAQQTIPTIRENLRTARDLSGRI